LWANMNAGHIVLLVIMGFIFIFKNWGVVVISVGVVIVLSERAWCVALVRAYVFSFLTGVFMGRGLHPGHWVTALTKQRWRGAVPHPVRGTSRTSESPWWRSRSWSRPRPPWRRRPGRPARRRQKRGERRGASCRSRRAS